MPVDSETVVFFPCSIRLREIITAAEMPLITVEISD